MLNKYVYTLGRDGRLQRRVVFLCLGLMLCGILVWLDVRQKEELQALEMKKTELSQLSDLKARVAVIDAGDGVVLTGIIFNDSRPMAVLNDQLYTAGDAVGKRKVAEITRESVSLCETLPAENCIRLTIEK